MATEAPPAEEAVAPVPLTADALAALGGEASAGIEAAVQDWETMSASSFEIISAVPKASWNELKSFAKPPATVKDVMGAVMLILGEQSDWKTARTVINNIPSRIRSFDPATLDATKVRALKKQLASPGFDVDAVKKVSACLPGVVLWLQAVADYSEYVLVPRVMP
mmetsp:Transcript_19123/g.52047  ORF Transcript_19123/g.52047 Transcript_19123/m.52047 type:complete len:165 (-) Transcript_19123:41-535(-)